MRANLLSARLSTLPTQFILVGQAQRADAVWTKREFMTVCEAMLNDNDLTHFMMAFQEAETGKPAFKKAKTARADVRASWAWDAITGKAKKATAVGFYPSNRDGQTRWSAMDFDAHDNDVARARRLSLDAFKLLLTHPLLYLVLCTSGNNGFHLFAFTRDFYPVAIWIELLKDVCRWIGTEIKEGICEIFPNEKAESQRIGKGIRAPGTVNPKTGRFSEIEAETLSPLLPSFPSTWSSGFIRGPIGKVVPFSPGGESKPSLYNNTNNYSLSTERLIEDIIRRHPIVRPGSRYGVLMKLIGHLSYFFERERAEQIVTRHYKTYEANIRTPLAEHSEEFEKAWAGQIENIRRQFTSQEAEKFAELRTAGQKAAFIIVRSFAKGAKREGKSQFGIVRASLADRLLLTKTAAGEIIVRLIQQGTIVRTEVAIPHKRAALYRWLLQPDPEEVFLT
jgi:hypothetical protein